MKIGIAETVTSGGWLKTVQVPEGYEDFVDVDDPAAVIAELKRQRPQADVFSFWQRLPDTQPRHPYPMEWDNVAAIEVTSYQDWLDRAVHPTVRSKLRKAIKNGVEVDEAVLDDELVGGMASIFNEAPLRQGRPYAHYGKTLAQIRAEWGIDLDFSTFIAARFQGELIGFVKLSYTDRYAEMSGTICKLAHRDKPAMTALIARCVRFCEERHIPYLCYGKFVYGNKGEDSLTDFKRHNGFRRIDVPRYFVPLTLRGRLALRLGLHHGLSQRLPPKVHRRLLEVRSQYYRWRQQPAS
jgi:hypothetical protein